MSWNSLISYYYLFETKLVMFYIILRRIKKKLFNPIYYWSSQKKPQKPINVKGLKMLLYLKLEHAISIRIQNNNQKGQIAYSFDPKNGWQNSLPLGLGSWWRQFFPEISLLHIGGRKNIYIFIYGSIGNITLITNIVFIFYEFWTEAWDS